MEKSIEIRSGAARAARSKPLLMLGLSLGYFMVLLDTTVVNVALPAIGDDLGGGIAGLQWVVNAYTIVFAGLLLSMGALADKLGAKRLYMWGLAAFLAASALCAASPSLGALIGLRAMLGIGGAALMPASLALLSHAYPKPAERARALGIWAAVTGSAMAAGPVIGGLLADSLGWRSIFLLQVPLGAASLLLTSALVGETERNRQRGFDPAGQLSAIAAIASLSYALMEGGSRGWLSPAVIAAFASAALGGCVFLLAERKGRAPILPLRLFRDSRVAAGMAAGMAINFGLSGILFVLPLYLQHIRGLSAHAAGLALLPLTVPLAVNPIVTGRIVGRIGAKLPMTAGFALAALGALTIARGDDGPGLAAIWAGLLAAGFGVSFTIPALMAAVMSAVPREQTGAASGALNSSRQLGAVLGVAMFGAIVSGSGTFMAGMRASLTAAAIVLLCGSLLSLAFIRKREEK